MLRRAVAMFGIALAASIALLVIADAVKRGAFDRIDVRAEMAMHRLDSAPADAIMMTATTVGSNYVLLPAVALVAALAVRKRARFAAIVLVIDTVAVHVLDQAIKLALARERPDLFEKISLPSDYSFPSGHAMGAMGIYGVIAAVLIALYPHARHAILACAIPLVALIGLSRIYLGVHWPSDVLGGYLGGIPPLVVSVLLLHAAARRRAYRARGRDRAAATA